MNKLLVLLLLFILPVIAFSQTKADYQYVMDKFIKFYNAQQYDSVYNLFSNEGKKFITIERNAETLKRFMEKYGKVTSYKYLGIDSLDPDVVTVFTTKWSIAGDKTTSFTLDKENKFMDWRFITSSDGIDKLLKNRK